MKFYKTLGLTMLSVVLLTAGGAVLVGAFAPNVATAHGSGGGHGHWGGHGRHGRGGDPCSKIERHSIRIAEVAIETHLDLDDAQLAQLQPMLQVVEDWRGDMTEACEAGSQSEDVPEALATLEGVLLRTAEAVRELQPAYASFYGSLTPEQRAHIDSAMARHHARHGQEG